MLRITEHSFEAILGVRKVDFEVIYENPKQIYLCYLHSFIAQQYKFFHRVAILNEMEGLVGSHSYIVFTYARWYQYKTWDMFCSCMYLPSSLSKFETDGCDMPRLGNTLIHVKLRKNQLSCYETTHTNNHQMTHIWQFNNTHTVCMKQHTMSR